MKGGRREENGRWKWQQWQLWGVRRHLVVMIRSEAVRVLRAGVPECVAHAVLVCTRTRAPSLHIPPGHLPHPASPPLGGERPRTA